MPINIDHTGNLILTTDSLLTFSMNGAVRMPVGTTAQRPGSPLNGMIRYNSTDDTFEGYIDGSWGPIGGSSSGGANVTISDTPPASPSVGDLWWDSDSADLFVYYDDGDSTQWVSTSNGAENVTQISANFLNNVDSDRIIGRVSAGNGDSEELTAAQVRTLLNVEDGATADQTGAEIVSLLDTELGSTDWQLNTVDVVSNVDSDRILGRTTSGNGDSEELTATQVRLLLNVEDGATADQTGAEIVSAIDTELSSSGWQNEGDVTKVGTPVDNQIGVWTGDGTIEGDTNLTWDGGTLQLISNSGVYQLVQRWVATLPITGNRVFSLLTPEVDNTDAPFIFQTGNSILFRVDAIDALEINAAGKVILQNGTRDIDLGESLITTAFNYNHGSAVVRTGGTFNVSSITDNATAVYTVNFANVFASNDYTISVMTRGSTAGNTVACTSSVSGGAYTTSSLLLVTREVGTANAFDSALNTGHITGILA